MPDMQEIRVQIVGIRDHCAGTLIEFLTGGCYFPDTRLPVDKTHAETIFQLSQTPADGGFGDTHFFRSPRNPTAVDRFHKKAKVLDLSHVQASFAPSSRLTSIHHGRLPAQSSTFSICDP